MGCQNVPVQDTQKQHDMQTESVHETEFLDVTEFAEDTEIEQVTETASEELEVFVVEDGTYTSKEEVAAYLHLYGELPDNFITKKEAKALGWVSTERNLAEVAPGMSIGGDYFGNYEGLLPEEEDRDYYECDINSVDGNRGAERIVYLNDGLIYYTPDHYDSFELLYGEE
ncbi:MAG: ribonuclease [Roseburia sp.]|nr:ribonuclease [Roseburia sp.]